MPKRRQGVWKDSEEEDEEYKAASAGSSESDGESERSFEKEVEQEEKKAEQEKRRRQVEQKRQQKAEQQKSEDQASPRRTRHRKKINYNEDALMRDLDEEIDEEEEEVDGGVRKRRKVGGGMPGSGSEAAEDEKGGNSSGEKHAVKNSSDSDFVPDMEEHEEPADEDFVVSDSDSVTGGRQRRRRSQKPQFVVKDDEETEEDGEFDPDSSLVGHRGRPRGSGRLRRRGRPRIHREEEEDEGEKSENSEKDEKNDRDEPKTLEEELQSLKEENEENGLPNGEGEVEGDGTPVHRHLRRRKQVNYTLPPPVLTDAQIEQMDAAARGALVHDSPRRRAGRYGGGSMYSSFHSAQGVRRLFPTAGPFGGSEVHALYGRAQAPASESEDSDATAPIPAAPNAAPSSGAPAGAVGAPPSSSSSDSEVEALVAEADRRLGASRAGADRTGAWRTTVQEGSAAHRRGRKSTLADTDPLGGGASIDFSCVGGLDRYISQLKEMITLPLLYPELYSRFQISPPRGVLFHGPPGTGKTLMARALASSCSAEGRKITFFMRKGSDCLSKWVGEAERNLRLLFQEAEKKQPSIIFFDEIDGLAPVRSSKQEQIHASIVSTLLALMDGIDNRGQVVVIGATNRPDAVDPALRRPGRFDREFYFPLPDLDSRAQIIRIHTKGWAHAPDAAFTLLLARMTRGYGGADLKALCAESALNAIQRTYPQIYGSRRRLVVDASQVRVSAADFARALRRIVPSSARPSGGAATGGIVGTGGGEAGTLRAAGAGSADGTDGADGALVALGQPPSVILLADQISALRALVQRLVPCAKQPSALEEARYVDFGARMPDGGFQMQQAVRQLDQLRVFRPRIVVCGLPGQAQRQVCESVLSALEGFVMQKLDFARLYSDASIVPETAAVRVFQELRAHEPAVLFVPDVLGFLDGCAVSVRSTIASMVRALPARAKVLILATIENYAQYAASRRAYDEQLRLVFGIECASAGAGANAGARASAVCLRMADPGSGARRQFFRRIWDALQLSPVDYNDVAIRPKRVLAQLPVAAGADADGAESAAAQAKREARRSARRRKLRARSDLRLKNTLKVRLSRLMDTFKTRYKRFRRPVVDDAYLVHLFEQAPDPAAAYQKSGDMIVEVATGKKFYNMDLEVIEERLWNGFYSEPRQFLRDLDLIVRDAKELGERDRIWKANEMYANAEVGVEDMEMAQPKLAKEWKELYRRERRRAQESAEANVQHQDADVQHRDDAAHAGTAAGNIVTSVVSSSGPQMQAQAQLRTGVPSQQHGELEDAEMRQDDRDMTQFELPGNSRKNGSEIVGEGDRPKEGGLKEHEEKSEVNQKEEIVKKKEIVQKETPQKEENGQQNNHLNIQNALVLDQNIPDTVSLDSDKVENLQNELLSKTEGARAESLESIFSRLIQIVWDNRLETDKSRAISQMDALIGSL